MRYQDQAIRMTKNATAAIFSAARAMPKDKLNWAVMDEGRTTLDLLQECAQSPMWFGGILAARAMPEFDEAAMAEGDKQRKQWKTIEACEKACNELSKSLYKAIKEFPDGELEKEIDLPFGDGFRASFADICMYQYWNLTYHWGQINYIQTLYGDKEMH